MLDGAGQVAGLGSCESQSELRVVVGGVDRDDPGEVLAGLVVHADVELRPRQRLTDLARFRLGLRAVLKELDGSVGVSALEQVDAPDEPVVHLARGHDVGGRRRQVRERTRPLLVRRTRVVPGVIPTLRHVRSSLSCSPCGPDVENPHL